MGMDSGWFTTFLYAFFESFACVELPIWKVIRVEADGSRTHFTDEAAWDETWRRISELRTHDPSGRYECGHSIAYRRCAKLGALQSLDPRLHQPGRRSARLNCR
jgi:hypothetical protein